MNKFFEGASNIDILLLMIISSIILHIIADFILQNNFMSTYKQKKNWEEYIKDQKQYKYDYIVVLLVHSFLWAFITYIPLLLYLGVARITAYIIMVIGQASVHAYIDNAKCNKLSLNLILDQLFHVLFQIIIPYILHYISVT